MFLFYPGQNPYFQIIAFQRPYFFQKHTSPSINIKPIPYVNSEVKPSITAQGVYIVDLSSFTPVYKKMLINNFSQHQQRKLLQHW